MDVVYLVAGLVLLVGAAELLVKGAVQIGVKLELSGAVIGALIIGLGTSAPEILATAIAAKNGVVGLALGNVVGSNIANVGLILGLAMLWLGPKYIHPTGKVDDYAIMAVVSMLFAAGCLAFGAFTFPMALVMLAGLVAYVVYNLKWNDVDNQMEHDGKKWPLWQAILVVLASAGVLYAGAELLVMGATGLALTFGIPESVVGLTMVALGTSLPELAATVSTCRHAIKAKSTHGGDMVLGNVLGSNTFNVLAAAMSGGLIAGQLPLGGISVDLWVMLGFATFILPFIVMNSKAPVRLIGGVLLAGYVTYIILAYV